MNFVEILTGIFSGLDVTASVTLLGMAYAVPFAIVFGVLQHFARGAAQFVVTAIIEFWRSTPVLVLLFVFYYTLPSFGIKLGGLTVASMTLGLNIGGYGSQSVRAALQSLDAGQVEAGRALGLPRLEILALIEMPQAFKAMIPTFVNQLIQLIKGTALVSLITLTDMTLKAKEIAQVQYEPASIYTALLVAYLVICYPATVVGRWLEARVGVKQHGGGRDL